MSCEEVDDRAGHDLHADRNRLLVWLEVAVVEHVRAPVDHRPEPKISKASSGCRNVAADLAFAGAGPDHIAIGACDGERPDRCDRLVVEDRLPVHAAIARLEDASRRRANIVDTRVSGYADDCTDAVALGTDVPPRELAVHVRIRAGALLGGGWRDVNRHAHERGRHAVATALFVTVDIAEPPVRTVASALQFVPRRVATGFRERARASADPSSSDQSSFG